MKTFHLHLVSDATGETVNSVARACLAQFEGAEPIEHFWSMIRTSRQLDRVLAGIEAAPGPVLYTLVNREFRTALSDHCRELQLPCVSVLDPAIHSLGTYLGAKSRDQPGRQHALDAEYFDRIEAMNFALNHDDGQAAQSLREADVILVGVSRTSKSPTCMYLANRGLKAANVPVVPGCPLPGELLGLSKVENGGPLVVGLTKDPARLIQVRRHRVRMLSQDENTDYTDPETVRAELAVARRLFSQQGWAVIDVTRRSIEETAAAVMILHARRRG
jgi:regulator of PEP synthase PpsR (kinase-PPPase family)